MDIIATRGTFGDFGRVENGKVLKDVSKTQAEKMIASGAFRQASSDDIKTAGEKKKVRSLAEKRNTQGGDERFAAVSAEVEAMRQDFTGAVSGLTKRIDDGIGSARKTISEELSAAQVAIIEAGKMAVEAVAKAQAEAIAAAQASAQTVAKSEKK